MNIQELLRNYREYERYYNGDKHDTLEWRNEFLEFVLWLADHGGLTTRAGDVELFCWLNSSIEPGEMCPICKRRTAPRT